MKPEALYLRGMRRWAEGRRSQSLADLRRALRLRPAAAGWRLSLAVLLGRSGRAAEARRECLESLKNEPRRAEAWLALADLSSGREARRCLEKAAALGGGGGREARRRLRGAGDEAAGRLEAAAALGDRGLWSRAARQLRAAGRGGLAAEALERESLLWKRAGKPRRAWAALSKALALPGAGARLSGEAAGLLALLGRRDQALAHYLAAVEAGVLEGEERFRLEDSLGMKRRAAATAQALARARPSDPAARLRAAEALFALGELPAAWEQGRLAAKLSPRQPRTLLFLAGLAQAAGRESEAGRLAESAWRMGAGPEAAALSAGLAESRGDYGLAARRWEACATPASLAERARLLLWRGRAAAAAGLARRALRAQPGLFAALRVWGGALTLMGRPRRALAVLDRARRLRPRDAETLCWRGEALRLAGRREEAAAALALSKELSINPLGALLNELLLRGGERPSIVVSFQKAAGLPPGCSLEAVLAKLGGNRSIAHTFLSGGRLRRFRFRSGKEPLLELQRQLAWKPAAKVLSRFDALARRRPSWGQLYTHRAEVNLWLGRYERARADFLKAWKVEPKLRWVKFGLCAVNLMRGRLGEARRYVDMALHDGGIPFSQWVWNGEVLRREGKPAEAAREFEKAVALYPRRPSAWANLALACGALGRVEEMNKIYRLLFDGARPLLLEAGCSLGLDLEISAPPQTAIPRLLERALLLMRGNRSSWMNTYVDGKGRLRSYQFIGG